MYDMLNRTTAAVKVLRKRPMTDSDSAKRH